jgi:hypothetical protein
MPVRYIKWLRGDAIREAYEIYDTCGMKKSRRVILKACHSSVYEKDVKKEND